MGKSKRLSSWLAMAMGKGSKSSDSAHRSKMRTAGVQIGQIISVTPQYPLLSFGNPWSFIAESYWPMSDERRLSCCARSTWHSNAIVSQWMHASTGATTCPKHESHRRASRVATFIPSLCPFSPERASAFSRILSIVIHRHHLSPGDRSQRQALHPLEPNGLW